MQTEIEKSPSPTTAESWNTSFANHPVPGVALQLLDNFRESREYRHAFVEEKVRSHVALQIKTIREQRQMSRPALAKLMGKAPSWIFRLEDPNQPPPTIPTLLQVAEVFDVDLHVNFGSFSGLLHRIELLDEADFEVPSFDSEFNSSASRLDAIVARFDRNSNQTQHSAEIIPFPKSKGTTEGSADGAAAATTLQLVLDLDSQQPSKTGASLFPKLATKSAVSSHTNKEDLKHA